MLIASWNVNGIRAIHKKGFFLPFIKKYKPEILCLQETKAEQNQSPINLPDYDEYWSSAERPGYSGTAIFVHQKLGKPLSFKKELPKTLVQKYKLASDAYGNVNKEGRVIALEFKNFYILSVYTPNAKDDLSRLFLRQNKWDPAFLEYVKLLDKKKPVIFCGDLNVARTALDLARPKENEGRKGYTKEERAGIEKIIAAGFVDTFRIFTKDTGHYTWWTPFANARARNIGWRIDYILVSEKLKTKIKSAKIHPEILGSDHCPVSIELK